MKLSQFLRPLLEFIDVYRRRISAPKNSIIHKKYAQYADLDYISTRLREIEDQNTRQAQDEIAVDFVSGDQFNDNEANYIAST